MPPNHHKTESESDTDFFPLLHQSRSNSVLIKYGFSILAMLMTALCTVLWFLGKGQMTKLDKVTDGMTEVRLSVSNVEGDVRLLKETMKTVALKSDVDLLKGQITEQQKEIDFLRRKVARADNP